LLSFAYIWIFTGQNPTIGVYDLKVTKIHKEKEMTTGTCINQMLYHPAGVKFNKKLKQGFATLSKFYLLIQICRYYNLSQYGHLERLRSWVWAPVWVKPDNKIGICCNSRMISHNGSSPFHIDFFFPLPPTRLLQDYIDNSTVFF
jgi:hypothetical protein